MGLGFRALWKALLWVLGALGFRDSELGVLSRHFYGSRALGLRDLELGV